jgi:aminoglycoside phosphotransferase (APT) family kinase protein
MSAVHAAANPSAVPFDLDALGRWLGHHLPGFTGLRGAAKFAGGQSNPTYRLRTGGSDLVMRCKPAAASQLLPSAHAIEREFRVMSALAATDVPVPVMHALCEDESVIGRVFYVMDFVDGRVLWDQALPGMAPDVRRAHYDEMNRVIAALHSVDASAIGLDGFGRAEGYFARQIARWTRQYRASETDTIAAMEALIEWLPAHMPPVDEASIVHGDFRIDNLVFAHAEPRVVAVLDWELSTIGHPLADFAYHCLSWHLSSTQFRGLVGIDPVPGIPGEREHIARYCARTGRSTQEVVAHWPFYLAFNLFRLAGITQGIVKRALEGTASNAGAMNKRELVAPLANAGWAAAQRAT